ncbi:MAG: alkaline phosphatase family protein [Candidatus Saccharimonadaceae bacterium]
MKSIQSFSGANIQIPDYDRCSIVQLPHFFASLFDDEQTSLLRGVVDSKIDLKGIDRVIFLLVDGFGTTFWKKHSQRYPALLQFQNNGFLGEFDTVFPSCTPNALNTVNSNGLSPAQHGLIDWWVYSKTLDKIVETLPFSTMGNGHRDSLVAEGVNPSLLLDAQTTYQALEANGIKTYVYLPDGYTESSYTKVAYNGSEIVSFTGAADLFNQIDTRNDRGYSFVYWNQIDSAAHSYGPNTPEHIAAMDDYFSHLEYFMQNSNLSSNTLLAISADHGQVPVNAQQTIYLDEVRGFIELLKKGPTGERILPWGAQREVFLAIEDGHVLEALTLLQYELGEDIELIESRIALEAGLFGDTFHSHPEIVSRVGDIIILPKDNKTVWYHHPGGEAFTLKGQHGGLSSDELKIPFGLLRFS